MVKLQCPARQRKNSYIQYSHIAHAAGAHRMVEGEAPVSGQTEEELLRLIIQVAADGVQAGVEQLRPWTGIPFTYRNRAGHTRQLSRQSDPCLF